MSKAARSFIHNYYIGFFMVKGYFRSMYMNIERETIDFRKYLKKTQRKNIIYWIKVIVDKILRI